MSLPLRLFVRANGRYLGELLLSSFLVNAFALALPLFSMLVYDKAIGNELHDSLWGLVIGITILLSMEACLRCSRILLVEHAGARWDIHLDQRLVGGVLSAPPSRALAVGELLSRYRELSGTRDFLSAQFLMPLADLPFALIYVLALLVIGGPIVLIPIVMGLSVLGASSVLQRIGLRRQQAANQAHSRKLSLLVDMLAARESLAGPGAAGEARAGWRDPSGEGARAAAQARQWSQFAQQLVPLGLTACSVTTLVAGVYAVEAQALTVGGLISSTMLGSRLVAAMCSLSPIATRWREFSRALDKLAEAVDLSSAATPSPWASAASPGAPGVARAAAERPGFLDGLAVEGLRLEAVSLRLPGSDRCVLDQLKLHLRVGELVALVGSSGCGKTTFLRLLAGHLAHTAGRFVCAGQVMDDDAQRRSLSQAVSCKPQEPVFISGTLSQIVAPGVADPPTAQLSAALRGAGLGPAIDDGELGFSSVIGANGAGVSGGQRQMLAIARVLFEPRDLVLLDEPTLGLDRRAQESLLRELGRLKTGRCVVVATHTSEVIQIADRVLVLDHGRIVADSTPAKLLGQASPPVRARPETEAVPA